jgi:DNA modification methylase
MNIDLPTEDEPVKVIHGDSVAMADELLAVADAIITDPPYGMNWDTNTTRFSGGHNPGRRRVGRNDRKPIHGDDKPFDPSPWLAAPKVVMFGANHYWDRLPPGSAFV